MPQTDIGVNDAPTDEELIAMADWYASLEQGRTTVESDALDH